MMPVGHGRIPYATTVDAGLAGRLDELGLDQAALDLAVAACADALLRITGISPDSITEIPHL